MLHETAFLGDWGPWYRELSQPLLKQKWDWMFSFHSISEAESFEERITERTENFDRMTVEELMEMLNELEHGYDIFYSTRVMLGGMSGHESEYGWTKDTLKIDLVHKLVNGAVEEVTLQISQPDKLKGVLNS